jgi:hypothetical protein
VAPIDSYAYCLLQKYRWDLTSQVRTIARTPRTPIPPLVAANPASSTLRAAFLEADRITGIAPLMADLLLERFVVPDPDTYDALRLNGETALQFWQEHAFAAAVHPVFQPALHFAS